MVDGDVLRMSEAHINVTQLKIKIRLLGFSLAPKIIVHNFHQRIAPKKCTRKGKKLTPICQFSGGQSVLVFDHWVGF